MNFCLLTFAFWLIEARLLLKQQNNIWNKFLAENQGSFLQSWEWGSFQENLGKKVWRLAIEEAGQTIAQAQIIKEAFPIAGKSLLYLGFGPTWLSSLNEAKTKEALSILWQRVQEIASSENTIFLLAEPLQTLPQVNGFDIRYPLKRLQPQKTLLLDLSKPEEEIFSNFQHKTTRYNIRFSEKQGVQFMEVESTSENLEIFNNLLRQTTQRDQFKAHPKDYYQKLFASLQGNPSAKLLFAKHKNRVVAASILVFFGCRASYLHAASDYQHRQLMAPYFLQWQQVLLAKKMGCLQYDLWGIDENKWPGLTYFKKSFGGQELIYPKGQDIVFQKNWYNLYKTIRGLLAKT